MERGDEEDGDADMSDFEKKDKKQQRFGNDDGGLDILKNIRLKQHDQKKKKVVKEDGKEGEEIN